MGLWVYFVWKYGGPEIASLMMANSTTRLDRGVERLSCLGVGPIILLGHKVHEGFTKTTKVSGSAR